MIQMRNDDAVRQLTEVASFKITLDVRAQNILDELNVHVYVHTCVGVGGGRTEKD